MKRRKYRTADELMAALEADPEWVADRARRDAEFERLAEERGRDEAPVLEALRVAGCDIDSLWNLANADERYPKAIPILVDHLQRPYPGEVRYVIALALAVPGARPYWSLLKRLYREEQDWRAKDGLATAVCALAKYSRTEHLDEVIELVRDRANGPSRLLLLSALEKSKEPRAWATLMDLGTDPDLVLEIQHILKKRQRKAQGRRPPRTNE